MFEKSLGLALSGGGIKAFAQIGAIKRMNEAKLKFGAFSGTSMGSIIATFLAAECKLEDIERRLIDIEDRIVKDQLLKVSNAQVFPLITSQLTGLISPLPFRNILNEHLVDLKLKHLNDIKLPLVIVSADLISGSVVYFTNRPKLFKKTPFEKVVSDALIIDALQASCSFPMVFENMMYDNMQLVDGGVLMNLPIKPLIQLGSEKNISITMENLMPFKSSKKVKDVAIRIVDMANSDAIRNSILLSDYNLNIYDKSIGIFSFGKGKEAIALGYQKASEDFDDLESLRLDLKRFRI